jgi:peroxiredoxin
VVKTVAARGIAPGEPAPDFELPMVGGGTWRLARHLNPPILLRFGSFS